MKPLIYFSIFIILFANPCLASSCAKWNYEGNYYWPTQCSACAGDRQSPINIDTSDVFNEDFIGPVRFVGYETPISGKLVNNGHVLQFNPDSIGSYKMIHQELANDYVLAQFHFHWGSTNDQGSEHTLDGKAFPMEMHLVHFNSKYSNLDDAIASGDEDALAVIGIMFHVGKVSNSALDVSLSNLTIF